MTNADIILEAVQRPGSALCDDCLSASLNIRPRQQVNRRARDLAKHGRLDRREGDCTACGRTKLVNSRVVSYSTRRP